MKKQIDNKIKVFADGSAICVLYGENIQDGICGFGAYINEAFDEFVKDFLNKFTSLKSNFSNDEIVGLYDFIEWQFGSSENWQEFYKNQDIYQEHQKIYFELKPVTTPSTK
jgi:hypothetical protein